MPNCLTASVLFRAYLKRLPSGVYRVTVLSAALPRPLFRSYPVELGEAVAVERSVMHALVVLKCARPVHAVDHLVVSPHAYDNGYSKGHSQTTNKHSEVESIFQHGSPHVVHQRSQHVAVSSAEQAGADGYAVKGGHGSVVQFFEKFNDDKVRPEPANEPRPPLVVSIKVNQDTANLDCNDYNANNHPLPSPQPTQHLRLRVVWQGLL